MRNKKLRELMNVFLQKGLSQNLTLTKSTGDNLTTTTTTILTIIIKTKPQSAQGSADTSSYSISK